MKKFLSLVLALVMTMSLVTVSAGAADFTDDADINYDEAVAVISNIGVVNGYADGSFGPEGGLTRQAAAKIICNMILGPTTAAELDADTNPYPDVDKDSAFAGYIAYCQKEGIISGYADGTFKGANPLTGYAFMKMLLGALGYDGVTEGYTGANWSINVAKKAIGIGLNAGLKEDFNGSDYVTREEAALYAFNTLKATMVEYGQQTTINVGGAEVVLAGAAQDLSWGVGTLNDGKVDKDGFVQFAEKYFSKLIRTDDTDAFGRPANTWSYNKTDIGTFVDYTKLAAEYTTAVTGKTVYGVLGSGVLNDDDMTLTVYVDGEETDAIKVADLNKNNTDDLALTGKGVLTQVYVDLDEAEVVIAIINTYLANTDDYNEKKETLALDEVYGYDPIDAKYADVKDLKLEDFAEIVDYTDDDMVLVTVAKGEVQSIADPEMIEEIEIDKYSEHKYVTVGGEQYDYAFNGVKDGSWGVELLTNYDNSNLNETVYTLYLDPYGYMIGIEVVTETTQYVFITAYDFDGSFLANKTGEASAIFTDGTMATIKFNVSKSTDLTDFGWTGAQVIVADGCPDVNAWFKYTVKDDVYSLTLAENQIWDQVTKATSDEINKGQISLFADAAVDAENENLYFYGNNKSNYILASVKDWEYDANESVAIIDDVDSVVTGVKNANLIVWDQAAVEAELEASYYDDQGVSTCFTYGVFALISDNGFVTDAVVIGEDTAASKAVAYLYGEPENEAYNRAEGMYYWEMNVVMNGKKDVVTFKSELPEDDRFDEGLWELAYDKDGKYVLDAEEYTADWLFQYDPAAASQIIMNDPDNGAVKLTADEESLWITSQGIKRGYALDEKCPTVIIEQYEDGTLKSIEYSSVEKAIKALDNYDKEEAFFDGTIYVFFTDGVATSVVLTDTITEVAEDADAPAKAAKVLLGAGKNVAVRDADNNDLAATVTLYVLGDNGYVEVITLEIDGTTDLSAYIGAGTYKVTCGKLEAVRTYNA